MRNFITCLLLVFMCGCSQDPQYKLVNLPSGKIIKVMGIGKMFFTKDDPALMLKYETDNSIDNKDLLRLEVEEIWPLFKSDVEHAKLTIAIISAHEPSKGTFIKTRRSFNFVFKRMEDGKWALQ